MTIREEKDGNSARRVRLPAAERRETILRAAADVFAEYGYRAAKVSAVAARIGVSEPVIFQNFGSKAALFAAVVERAAAEARTSLDQLATGPGPVSGLLAHVLAGPDGTGPGHSPPRDGSQAGAQDGARAGAQDGAQDAARDGVQDAAQDGRGHGGIAYGVLFADAAALATEPELAGPARDAVRAVAAHLADLVRHAQAHGGARPDADPEAAAWLLLSMLSARRLRTAAMPAGLEPAVTALALQALTPPTAG